MKLGTVKRPDREALSKQLRNLDERLEVAGAREREASRAHDNLGLEVENRDAAWRKRRDEAEAQRLAAARERGRLEAARSVHAQALAALEAVEASEALVAKVEAGLGGPLTPEAARERLRALDGELRLAEEEVTRWRARVREMDLPGSARYDVQKTRLCERIADVLARDLGGLRRKRDLLLSLVMEHRILAEQRCVLEERLALEGVR